jgi:hypothetical protein
MAEPYASARGGERGPFEDTRGQEGTLRDRSFQQESGSLLTRYEVSGHEATIAAPPIHTPNTEHPR